MASTTQPVVHSPSGTLARHRRRSTAQPLLGVPGVAGRDSNLRPGNEFVQGAKRVPEPRGNEYCRSYRTLPRNGEGCYVESPGCAPRCIAVNSSTGIWQ